MSRKIFLDTNIVLDLLGRRDPFYEPIAKIATMAEMGKLTLVASPITFTTVNYILAKFENTQIARQKLRQFKIICEVGPLNDQIVDKGLNATFKDFEDALQYFCALHSDCEIILTRNAKDFKNSALPIMTAEQFLKSLG